MPSHSRSSCAVAGLDASLLVNVPAHIAVERSYLAYLRGDAEATAAFASRAPAKLGKGERLLEFVARWSLAMAEWLRGRLTEAERAFVGGPTSLGSRSAAWPGSSVPLTSGTLGRAPGPARPPRRCRA